MKHFLYSICFFVVVSCTESSNPKREIYSNPPSKEFVSFCSDVIAKNWSSDTTRLFKKELYSELSYKSLAYIENQPFYPILFENSQVNHVLKSNGNSKEWEVFKDVKGVWGYFYFKETQEGMFPDGLIEQWEFETKDEANEALKIMREFSSLIFFNTEPYQCVVGNKLYLFHTRAMAFSYDQKPLFLEFVKRNKAKI
jgi:hypothetical protein